MNIDSILLFLAYYAKLKIEVLPFPQYHIDHGSGFTPENEQNLRENMQKKSIGWLEWPVINVWLCIGCRKIIYLYILPLLTGVLQVKD